MLYFETYSSRGAVIRDVTTGREVDMPHRESATPLFTEPVVLGCPDLSLSFSTGNSLMMANVAYGKMAIKLFEHITSISCIPRWTVEKDRILKEVWYCRNGVCIKSTNDIIWDGIGDKILKSCTLLEALYGVDVTSGVVYMNLSDKDLSFDVVRIEFDKGASRFITKSKVLGRTENRSVLGFKDVV